jgi:hypothetical protein
MGNLMDIYYVLLNIASVSYCYYTCELSILGTRIEVWFHFVRPGYDKGGFWHLLSLLLLSLEI